MNRKVVVIGLLVLIVFGAIGAADPLADCAGRAELIRPYPLNIGPVDGNWTFVTFPKGTRLVMDCAQRAEFEGGYAIRGVQEGGVYETWITIVSDDAWNVRFIYDETAQEAR